MSLSLLSNSATAKPAFQDTLSVALAVKYVDRAMSNGQTERLAQPPQLRGLSFPGAKWDATKTAAPPDLLQLGFELGHFLVPNRSSAIDILTRALEKLRLCSHREMKRLYWRDKHDRRPVRRLARTDLDLLQWLILSESEREQRAQEGAGAVSPVRMIIHYVKHMVPDHDCVVLLLRQCWYYSLAAQLQHVGGAARI